MDLLISGGQLIDGTGAPRRRADLAVRAGRIAAIGDLSGAAANRRIDASDSFVCPGLIDIHSHSDLALLSGWRMDGRLRQGITTEVVGQDGLSYAPADPAGLAVWRRYLRSLNGDLSDEEWTWQSVGDWIARLDGAAANAVYLVPHGAVRVCALGWAPRPATGEELGRMQRLVEQALREGAAGLSTGLNYVPCAHADTDEMIALCRPVAEAGGVYSTHLRSYGAQLLQALDEAVEIGRQSGVAVHVSHLRVADPSNWGLAPAILERVDRAREGGVDLTFDLYPYTVGCAPLFALLPAWVLHGGPDAILPRLRDAAVCQRMLDEMAQWPVDWSAYQLCNVSPTLGDGWEGLSLDAAAARFSLGILEAIPRLLLETDLDATIIAAGGNKADNEALFRHPCAMVGSDGVLVGGRPHPRGFGAFPRVLSLYVRERGLLSWEEAIAKMTGLPAARLNLADRGELRVGAAADIIVLDPARVQDRATFRDGMLPPDGVHWVLVNGQVVVDDGHFRGGRFGKSLTGG